VLEKIKTLSKKITNFSVSEKAHISATY